MEVIHEIAFVTIFVSALIDAFFLTGLVFYGVVLMGTAATLHAMGEITTLELMAAAFLGSTIGSIINFYIGHFFGHVKIVKRFTQGDKVAVVKKRLAQDGLFWTMALGKFIGIFRPLYALILGVLHTNQRRFLCYEIFLALLWTIFWTMVLLFGEEIFTLILQ
jgi:membrane protein DedA with SNARE-associated domain